MDAERVILVDADDREVGSAEKLDAHARGLLHRALSVFLFDAAGRVLLQRRAATKYHSGDRWSNTCCSHPRPGEATADAATRRLREEMGVTAVLEHALVFTYRAEFEDGLVEHEVDHVFTGRFDGAPTPNSAEVGAWAWRDVDELEREIAAHPARFAPWLPLALERLRAQAKLPGASA
jgi:isopentenyl-diphosphate delta-isomerase